MRLRIEIAVACCVLAWGACCASPTYAEDRPSQSEISAAVAQLKADPNLSSKRTIRMLHWSSSPAEQRPDTPSSWAAWIGDLFGWLAETSRLLLWALCIVLVGFLTLYLTRFVRSRTQFGSSEELTVPSHVRDLDIRPESLPDDIGAASLVLWERGEQRQALSLLYRGLLSRLVHVHSVPIRNASTEGECLALAAHRLGGDQLSYVARLVKTWQRAIYGGIEPSTEDVRSLCDEFKTALALQPDTSLMQQPA